METMLNDVIGSNVVNMGEAPNASAEAFYNMLQSAQQPLYEGCTSHSELSAAMRLLSIKSTHNMSQRCFNDIVHMMHETTPTPNRLPTSFADVKQRVKELGLDAIEIDCCRNGCMIYYKDDGGLTSCKFCQLDRFMPKKSGPGRYKNVPYAKMHYMPLIPRLQRLYASKSTAEHMVWYSRHCPRQGQMIHPSDGEAWKHFDRVHPNFVADLRNGRLGLCVGSTLSRTILGRI